MATSSEKFCSMCNQIHLTVQAIEYCPECEEFLCVDCKRHHSLSKSSKFHATMNLQHYLELPPIVQSATGICRDHDKCFEMYCTEHRSPFCARCLSAHSECKVITSLTDAVKDVKLSSSVTDLEQTIKDLIDYTKRIKDKLFEDKANTLSQKTNIIAEIAEARTKINNHLDSLEKKILDSLSKTVDGSIYQIDSLISEISAAEKRLHSISADMNKSKQYASDFQVFITLKEIESSVSVEEHFLWSLNENKRLDYNDIRGKTDQILQQIGAKKKFGDIEQHTVPCDVTLVKKKNKQAQIGTVICRTLHNISLSLFETLKIQTKNTIKGFAILSKVCSYIISEYDLSSFSDSVSIKPVNGNQRTLKCISKSNYDINDFVVISDTTFVATSNYGCNLYIVDYINDKIIRQMEVDCRSSGITINDRTLFYCVHDIGIESYHLDTQAMKMILENKRINKNSYIDYWSNHLYFIYDNVVACCDMTGTILWKFENMEILNGPRGIAVDKSGYIYVAGERSENVVLISATGAESRQLLGKHDGLRIPQALKYDSGKHRLIVSNTREHLFVFDIK